MRRLGIFGLLAVLILQWGCGKNNSSPTSPSSPSYTYPFVFNVGDYGISGSGNGQFSNPSDPLVYHNALFVVDQANRLIEKFDLAGNFLGQVSTGGTNPRFLAVDGNGVLYLGDYSANTITKWDVNLNSLGTLTTSIATSGPRGLAFDSSNRIYIADGGKAMRCANNGTGCVTVAGSFSLAIDLAVDGSGNVYIDDESNSNIRKFDSNLSGGTTIISAGSASGQVSIPLCIAVDTDGNLLVGDDPGPGRVQKFSPTGTYLTAITSPASETFGFLTGIAVDANTKDVYIADYSNHVVYNYAPY